MGARGEPLGLEHQARIEALLARTGLGFSEASFANLFLFRAQHAYRFVDGPAPCIMGITYDGTRHAFPLATPPDEDGWPPEAECLYPCVPGPGASFNPADSDYIYDAANLALLAGSALKPKRQQAEAYRRRFAPVLTIGDTGFGAAAGDLLALWQAQTGKLEADTDHAACAAAIAMADELGLETVLLRGGGVAHGFLLASRLPDGSKAVHFAKARRDIAGSYPALFSAFAREAGVARLNFEQDLGHPGFRQAKRALGPCYLLPKYRKTRKCASC